METEKKILKGFNAGYLIAKHNPELFQKLKQGIQKNENPFSQGFFSGSNEFKKEEYDKKMKSYFVDKQKKDKDIEFER